MTSDEAQVKRLCADASLIGDRSSKLFSHFRAIGRVSNAVPATIHYMGGIPYITTSVGYSFQIFDVETLNLKFVSSEAESPILALCSKDDRTVAVVQGKVHFFDRARLESTFSLKNTESFVAIDVMGDSLVVLSTRGLELWDFSSAKYTKTIAFTCDSMASCFVHPITYLNKLLIGFEDGHLELWNINSGKMVFSFSPFNQSVTSLAAAPAIDIIAVGLKNGMVYMVDVRQDKVLFSLSHESAVTKIAFRTDISECSQMAVALDDGKMALWDLEERRLHSTWTAHDGTTVSTAAFIQNQPVIITTANDNAIREWIIDGSEVRLLRSRSGHAKTPRLIKFYGENGEGILSAGRDRSFRLISLIKDSQSTELSQGSIESIARRKKLKEEEIKLDPIIAFDIFLTKDLKWDNVVTAHEKSCVARTWRADHKKLGSHELRTVDRTEVTAVAMSACGNFALLGTFKGTVDVFNVQSGHHRKHFIGSETNSPVVGLGIDAANQYVIISHRCGLVRCLEMADGQVKYRFTAESQICSTNFHSDSQLLALILENDETQVIDVESFRLVRRFSGHTAPIIEAQFSYDARWLLTASTDKTVRTWDLATGLQIDTLFLPAIPVSLAFSPIMDFLAVVLEGDVAIHVWTNLSMYQPVAFEHSQGCPILTINAKEEELVDQLIQLSIEPRSKWSNLFHLETIKARNKPTLPPKPAEKAPFFLDALLASKDDDSRKRDVEGTNVSKETSAPLGGSAFTTLLFDEKSSSEAIFSALKILGPSVADFEIRMLTAHSALELQPLIRLINIVTNQLESRRDYELAITYLNVILKAHTELFLKFPAEFVDTLQRAKLAVRSNWGTLEVHFQKALCLTSFSRDL